MTPGLFDGFEGYVTPTIDDYREIFAGGIVAIDANVLLNLYRYAPEGRDDLLTVLRQLGDQLWVPHQALEEFWRNRENILRDPREAGQTESKLKAVRDSNVQMLETWANRVSLPAGKEEELTALLREGLDAVVVQVREFADAQAAEWAKDTAKDSVLAALREIVDGRVGEEMDVDRKKAAIAEGLKRCEAGVPPGFKDKSKDKEEAVGDYLVWEQVLCHAAACDRDVLFVTGDLKEDWWRKEAGERRGPRIELVQELHDRCGRRLFMMRPTRLLELAGDLLNVALHEETVEDADRVERLLSEASENALADGGWTRGAAEILFERLRAEAPVQSMVVAEAAAGDGFVSRERVYELGGYEEGRSLRGFTRPVNRITEDLRSEGMIASRAIDPMWTVYDEASANVNLAAGFRVREEVLPLFEEALGGR